jgi:hypothetical protein
MRTIAFNLFPRGEQEVFRSSCRRWGRSPAEFNVRAEEHELSPGSNNASHRDVIVRHMRLGKARRYEAGGGSDWNGAFEDDLQALFFSNYWA